VRRVPTFVLSGLSKVCGMPQLKLGWIALAGPEPARDEALRGLEWISDLFLSVGMPVQHALPRLLEARHEFQSLTRTRIQSNLESLARFVARRPEVTRLEADGGWIAILRMPAWRSGEEWALDLLERGVIVHPGHFYDIEREAHLVVSLIVNEDAMERALAIFEGALAGG
jgi:aspartate/methionine/tyrosine aminotransferase